jgi:hypothetical protein
MLVRSTFPKHVYRVLKTMCELSDVGDACAKEVVAMIFDVILMMPPDKLEPIDCPIDMLPQLAAVVFLWRNDDKIIQKFLTHAARAPDDATTIPGESAAQALERSEKTAERAAHAFVSAYTLLENSDRKLSKRQSPRERKTTSCIQSPNTLPR